MSEAIEQVQWCVAWRCGEKRGVGRERFAEKKAAEKAASKIEAMSGELGLGFVYYAEPAVTDQAVAA